MSRRSPPPAPASRIHTLALPGRVGTGADASMGTSTADIFIAREPDRRFAMHWHDAWSVGTIVAGHCGFVCDGARLLAEAGDLIVMAPGSMHAAGVSLHRFGMTMLYLPPDWVASACAWPAGQRPARVQVVRHDPELGDALSRAALLADAPALAEAAAQALRRAADGPMMALQPPEARDPRVQALANALGDPDAERLDMAAMAARLQVSREHLQRLFRKEVGLTPGEYARCARLHAARHLLRDGASLAEAAAASGFADQAHFARWFRRIFGVTPTNHDGCRANDAARRVAA